MSKQVIVLSGPIASGKSELGTRLADYFDGTVFKSNDILKAMVPSFKRDQLQRKGDQLDKDTNGAWVATGLQSKLDELANQGISHDVIVVDSVRIEEQVDSLRRAYGSAVLHIHLTASKDVLAARYAARKGEIEELADYDQVRKNRTEKNVEKLADKADVVIHTDKSTSDDVFVRASAHVRLYPQSVVPLVDVLVGGQWGSEGKGNVAAYISGEYKYLVRVGGPNAGHKVYGDPGYTFHHLPSGTKNAPEATILLGPGMVINKDRLLKEISENQLSHERLVIDPQAIIIEQKDIRQEERTQGAISSTAQGVGAATSRRILDRGKKADGKGGVRLAKEESLLKPYVAPISDVLEKAFAKGERVLLEGTQGTALSLYHGHYPYVTSRDTTVAGCLAEAGISPKRVRKVIMVCRTYPIRVGGTSGPMGTELDMDEIATRSGLDLDSLKKTERTSTTNRPRRIAEFSWDLFKKSCVLNAPTDIALTFADYIDANNQQARRFEQLTEETINLIEELERVARAPVSLISTRFHWRSIIDRRNW